MTTKVSDAIADFLVEREVRHVFGIIGSGNANIFDAITRRGYTEIVCVHHEQAAVMAAQAYFRTSGRVSATLVTTGAGSSNAVTGVVSAWMDSIPVLIISGNENSKFTHPDNPLRFWGVQGYDSSEMVRGVTKYASRIMEPDSIHTELDYAYDTARCGRPGPVWLDVPMNIQAATVDGDRARRWRRAAPESGAGARDLPPAERDMDRAAAAVLDLLRQGERPVLWLGHGIRLAGAVDQLVPLMERLQAPTLVSWAGIDMVDSGHRLVYGRAGVYGQRAANFVLQNCDLLVTIGTRLAIPQVGYDLSEFARAATIACVDIDPAEAVKHGQRVRLPICGDAKAFILSLFAALEQHEWRAADFSRPSWIAQCDKYRAAFPEVGPEHADQGGFLNSYPFMRRLEAHFKANQVVVTDAGTALLSGHQILRIGQGQRLMTSTGLGEMGFGLPAAIGASFGTGRGEVLCLNCDGGMMMNLQELQTIAHHRLPIKIIVFNNDGYLMIKHTQNALFQGRRSAVDAASGVTCPDFSKVGAAFNMPTYQIRTWDDMDEVMPRVQGHAGPVICEVFMHPDQLFVPKLSLALRPDGSIVSPPLEDLSPLLPRDELRKHMIIGLHPKSETL